MATLEERIISGKGVLKLSATAADESKVINIFADVVRLPSNPYLNFAYNPPRARYATLQLLRGGYVVDTLVMEYENQVWERYPDQGGQSLYAIACAYQGILDSFANLGTALGLTLTEKENDIKGWEHIKLWFDEIKVVCYSDTAIRVVVEDIAYDFCLDLDTPDGAPPPTPPAPPPEVPVGVPMTDATTPVSPPYEEPDDGGDTVPYPDDAPDPFPDLPLGTACQVFTCTCTVKRRNTVNNAITNFTYNFYVRAPIEGYYLVTGVPGKVQFLCRGANQNLGGSPPSCLPSVTLVDAAVQLSGQEFLEWVVEPTFTPV